MEKLFFKQKITYKKVVLGAVIVGVITGLLMTVKALENTSFQNIGICFESWIILAMIIIMNSHKATEAGFKTFLFFLISQPIIYLVQVPFAALGWKIFMYYKRWFILTLATLPGGMIAWYVKKKTTLSALILSVATTLLFAEGVNHAKSCIKHFPHQLLATVLCFGTAVLFIQTFLKKKQDKIMAYCISAVLGVGLAVTMLF